MDVNQVMAARMKLPFLKTESNLRTDGDLDLGDVQKRTSAVNTSQLFVVLQQGKNIIESTLSASQRQAS